MVSISTTAHSSSARWHPEGFVWFAAAGHIVDKSLLIQRTMGPPKSFIFGPEGRKENGRWTSTQPFSQIVF